MREVATAHKLFLPFYAGAEDSGLHYHNINHVKYIINKILNLDTILNLSYMEEMFGTKATNEDIRRIATVLVYAAYGHDCYYDPYLKDGGNETISAEITYGIMGDTVSLSSIKERVVRIITHTAAHLNTQKDLVLTEKLFLDLDLYSFADNMVYENNNKAVEDEYWNTPRAVLLHGRASFLKKLLERERIFYMLDGEETARANIAKTIDAIEFELENTTGAVLLTWDVSNSGRE